jgi:glycosyltransferase involved in cell wall biosynthesis
MVSSQPTQNAAPLRLMAAQPKFETVTAYCSLPDPKLWRDAEHLNKEAFDTPVLDGYDWTRLANWSPFPSLGKFYGLINPGVIPAVLRSDCCIVFGHSYITFWLAIITAKLSGKPLLLTTDATYLEPASGANWKTKLKTRVMPFLYNRLADTVLVPSTASHRFLRTLGISEERIVITPYVVDNEYIQRVADNSDREAIRKELEIPVNARVVVFCAKFIARKRPHDALRGFARAAVVDSYLLMIGDGPLIEELKREAATLGISDRVRFTGLVKYSRLPEFYAASDVLVFPSEHEPYGLPVNEAMICGVPVIASDRVGAAQDLIREGETGFTYPCGDVDSLASTLCNILSADALRQRMGEGARLRMRTWSAKENAEATLTAAEKAMSSKVSTTEVRIAGAGD